MNIEEAKTDIKTAKILLESHKRIYNEFYLSPSGMMRIGREIDKLKKFIKEREDEEKTKIKKRCSECGKVINNKYWFEGTYLCYDDYIKKTPNHYKKMEI